MSREKQIEEMTESLCDIQCKGMKCNTCDRYGCEYRMLAEALYNAGYRKQEWISVAERLPEENGRYFVCVAIRHLVFEDLTIGVIMGYSKINGFDVVSGEETVTHWMPLPEAPKMKGGAE